MVAHVEELTFVRRHLAHLRHEAESRYDQAGVPVSTVSKLLGRANLTTTTTYLNTPAARGAGKLANDWQSDDINAPPEQSAETPPKSLI